MTKPVVAPLAAALKSKPPKPIAGARTGWLSTDGSLTKSNVTWGNASWGQWQRDQGSR